MWSGKTTISQSLAQELWIDCIDLDDETRKLLNGMEIPEYIQTMDWGKVPYTHFRTRESEAVQIVLDNYPQDHVLSLGWGTFEMPQFTRNVWLLKQWGYLGVYINPGIDMILARKSTDDAWNVNRMALDEDDERRRYAHRDPLCREASWLVITNTGTIRESVDQILGWLHETVV